MTTDNQPVVQPPDRIWLNENYPCLYRIERSSAEDIEYARVDGVVAIVDEDLVDRATVLRELMRISCASPYCVCVPMAVEKIRGLPAQTAAATAPIAAPVEEESESR